MVDITIAGASYTSVPSIIIPKTGGGDAQFYDRDIALDFMGIDAEFVKNVYDTTTALKNTLYNGWTPSTTAKTIVTSVSLTDKFAADTADYDYYLKWRFDTNIQYTSTVTLKTIPIRNCIELYQAIIKRPSSFANITAEVYNSNACVTFFTAPFIEYYNSSGTRTFAYTGSYGFYIGATAATFSNSTTDAPSITIKTPTITARCSTTYFATARGGDIDQANTQLRVIGDIYRAKVGSSPARQMYKSVLNLFKNPLFT